MGEQCRSHIRVARLQTARNSHMQMSDHYVAARAQPVGEPYRRI
ncbi:hypothetical protein VIBNISOn1_p0066 [Vibrio nigripulchritudo SOn1]|uniref:Uncharacterized protein n=1 Tax=Vibrio nigripulchritudo SOn1 TaxID=1238450 RepID=A0AAV2W016_9VIBR|nr:hypothetical protein VIBNISOn1_p0066 [Vibrio nigripulchritudo SOn1]